MKHQYTLGGSLCLPCGTLCNQKNIQGFAFQQYDRLPGLYCPVYISFSWLLDFNRNELIPSKIVMNVKIAKTS